MNTRNLLTSLDHQRPTGRTLFIPAQVVTQGEVGGIKDVISEDHTVLPAHLYGAFD